MVESSAAAPDRDVLLATELHMPGSRPGQVPRPRLTARLDEGLAPALMLVCAPAEYGKTVLLAEWARRGGYPVAWLSLAAGDKDPAGSGATPWPRWTGSAPGPANGWPRSSARPRRRCSRDWSRR